MSSLAPGKRFLPRYTLPFIPIRTQGSSGSPPGFVVPEGLVVPEGVVVPEGSVGDHEDPCVRMGMNGNVYRDVYKRQCSNIDIRSSVYFTELYFHRIYRYK